MRIASNSRLRINVNVIYSAPFGITLKGYLQPSTLKLMQINSNLYIFSEFLIIRAVVFL